MQMKAKQLRSFPRQVWRRAGGLGRSSAVGGTAERSPRSLRWGQVAPHLPPPPCILRALPLPPQGLHGDQSRERLGGGPEWSGSSTGSAHKCRHGVGGRLGRGGPGEAASGPVDRLRGLLLAETRVPGGSGEAPSGSGTQPRHLRKGPAPPDGRDAGAHGGCALELAAGAVAPSPAPPHSAGDGRLVGHNRSVIEGGPLSSEQLCLGCKKRNTLWCQPLAVTGPPSRTVEPKAQCQARLQGLQNGRSCFGVWTWQFAALGAEAFVAECGFSRGRGCPPCL